MSRPRSQPPVGAATTEVRGPAGRAARERSAEPLWSVGGTDGGHAWPPSPQTPAPSPHSVPISAQAVEVATLAITPGGTLYVGGGYTDIAGGDYDNLAAIAP